MVRFDHDAIILGVILEAIGRALHQWDYAIISFVIHKDLNAFSYGCEPERPHGITFWIESTHLMLILSCVCFNARSSDTEAGDGLILSVRRHVDITRLPSERARFKLYEKTRRFASFEGEAVAKVRGLEQLELIAVVARQRVAQRADGNETDIFGSDPKLPGCATLIGGLVKVDDFRHGAC